MHLSPARSPFMVLEACLKGSVMLVLTECFNVTGVLSLNFFFQRMLLLICKNTIPYYLISSFYFLISSSTGSNYFYIPLPFFGN